MAEFLPLCDVLFNVISLAGYFCDVVFDVVMGYALLDRGYTGCFIAVVALVGCSLIVSQILSLRWYLHNNPLLNQTPGKLTLYTVVVIHCFQMGVLWRYAKLFVPVDLRYVKHEVRDLLSMIPSSVGIKQVGMLRLVHAFCQAAPMLLLQLYILKADSGDPPPPQTFYDLNIVAALLSLFSVCWALASFSKNVRLQNVHRLVLTWLGVIFQFLWRIGTVCSRVTALTVYVSLYAHWVFLVIGLHWMSMFLWLISPKNVFHGERISRTRKAVLGALIAFVYVFAYVNLQEVNHRQKMVTFYVVMFLENCLLVVVWLVGVWPNRPADWPLVPGLVVSTFAAGVMFMMVYYRYFHVQRLRYEAGGRFPNSNNNKCAAEDCILGECKCAGIVGTTDRTTNDESSLNDRTKYQTQAIPGVFNCRFSHPAGSTTTKRKKKKPTSFVPPPTLSSLTNPIGPAPIPFWRKPLPSIHNHQGGSSENEGSSVGSRVNIHQKLQEKKQKQLAELKIIEEEIKQGKLGGPTCNSIISGDESLSSLPRQPIPISKKHIDIEPVRWAPPSPKIENLGNLGHHLGLISYLGQGQRLGYDGLNQILGYNAIKYAQNSNTLQSGFHQDARNMSPISQISATESNSLTRQVLPRSKIQYYPRQLTAMYPDNHLDYPNDNSCALPTYSNRINYNPICETQKSASPRIVLGQYDQDSANRPQQYADINAKPNVYDRTYNESSNVRLSPYPLNGHANGYGGNLNLPFPYHIVPPPKSKLDRPGIIQRAKTPEILLSPHYLDSSRVYNDWNSRDPLYRLSGDDKQATTAPLPPGSAEDNHCGELHVHSGIPDRADSPGHSHRDSLKAYNVHSDIDSQVSLPRSYTLPREFKYYRRNRGRKFIRNDHFIASTNSSDADVDSGDDVDSEQIQHTKVSHPQKMNIQPAAQITHKQSMNTPSYGHFTNHPSYSRVNEVTFEQNAYQEHLGYQMNLEQSKKSTLINHNVSRNVTSHNVVNNANNLASKCLSVAINSSVPNTVAVITPSGTNEGQGVSPAHGRQLRSRVYGVLTKGIRHETKL